MNIPINWDLVTSDVKQFSFEGEQKTAKVVDVYDGDTIKVVFALNEKVFKFNCRITGVDTPEVRTKNKLEKEMGLKVRDELRKKILNKVVTIYCDEFDKMQSSKHPLISTEASQVLQFHCDGYPDNFQRLW